MCVYVACVPECCGSVCCDSQLGGRVMECIRCVVTEDLLSHVCADGCSCAVDNCLAVEVVFVLAVLTLDCRLGRCRIVVE
jgi:hypothetical protein